MNEIWKPIPEFENCLVSNKGRIKNKITNKLLKPFLKISKDKPTYRRYRIMIQLNKRRQNFCIHKLVGKLFVPNENGYTKLLFIDQDPSNITSENLKWISDEEFRSLWKAKLSNVEYKYYGNDSKPIRATHIYTGNVIEFDSISAAVKFFHTQYNFVGRVLRGVQTYHKEHKFELINKQENNECSEDSLERKKKKTNQNLQQQFSISMI